MLRGRLRPNGAAQRVRCHLLCSKLQAFTIMDQNRDGFIDKNDLRDTFAALGEPSRAEPSLVDLFFLSQQVISAQMTCLPRPHS